MLKIVLDVLNERNREGDEERLPPPTPILVPLAFAQCSLDLRPARQQEPHIPSDMVALAFEDLDRAYPVSTIAVDADNTFLDLGEFGEDFGFEFRDGQFHLALRDRFNLVTLHLPLLKMLLAAPEGWTITVQPPIFYYCVMVWPDLITDPEVIVLNPAAAIAFTAPMTGGLVVAVL